MGLVQYPSALDVSTSSYRDHVSYSAVRTYLNCPQKFFYKYVLGLPETTVAASLLFGSAFHEALAAYYRALMIGFDLPSVEEFLESFWAAWQSRQVEEIRFGKSDTLDSLGHLAERMFVAFLASDLARPSGVILAVEEELRGSLAEGLPDLLARLDLVFETEESLVVRDFKTSRTSWDDNKVMTSADQLLLYSDLVSAFTVDKPIRLEFAVLTKTKAPLATVHPVNYDPRQVERIKRIVERVWNAVANEHFYPNPSHHCASCSFRKPCREWQG